MLTLLLLRRSLRSIALNTVALILAMLLIVSHLSAQSTASKIPLLSTAQQPLSFIENKGQWNSEVRYMARLRGMNVWLTDGGFVYDFHLRNEDSSLSGHVVRMKFVGGTEYGGKRHIPSHGEDQQTAYYNYFLGNDRSKWASNVPLYDAVRLEEVYPGIAARAYFEEGQMRYDMIVAPKADASKIALEFDGADGVRVNHDGDLVLQTSVGEVVQGKLYAYQVRNGRREQISCRFSAKEQHISFALGNYDSALPLVIDPLVWSTFLNSSSSDEVHDMTTDQQGNIIAVGRAWWQNFPTTAGAYLSTNPANATYGYITRLSPGGALITSTFIGAKDNTANGLTACRAVALDGSGNIYVTGYTATANFPTINAVNPTYAAATDDAFICKFTPNLSTLMYSTYWGGNGNDYGQGIGVDAAGIIYVAGFTTSTNLPTSTGALQSSLSGGTDFFVLKIDPSAAPAAQMLYSSYFGGSSTELARCLRVQNGKFYVSGISASAGITTANAYQPTLLNSDAIFFILNPLGGSTTDLQYCTYYNSFTGEEITSFLINADGTIWMVGSTGGGMNFPITFTNAFQTNNIGTSGFIGLINPAITGAGGLLYSSYFGNNSTRITGITKDPQGNIIIDGITNDQSFPTTPGAIYPRNIGGFDRFIAKFAPSPNNSITLQYCTLFGGSSDELRPLELTCFNCIKNSAILLDGSGNAIIGGETNSRDLPITSGVVQTTPSPNISSISDGFISKLSVNAEYPLRTGFGSAIEFDGTQRLLTQNSFRPPQWTVECWVRSPEAPSGAKTTYPFTHGPNAGIAFVWDHTNPAFRGAAQVLLSDGVTYIPAKFGNLEGNTWYHLAATFDGRVLRAYQDGVLTSQQPIPAGLEPNNTPIIMGFGVNPTLRFRGTLDEVRYWNTALPDTTISRFKGQELTGIPPQHPNAQNLIGYWRFNDYAGLIAIDASRSRYDATLVGMNGGAVVPATQDNSVFVSPRTPSVVAPRIIPSIGQPSSSSPVNVLLSGANGGSALATVSVNGQSLQYTPQSPNFVPQGFTDRINYRLAQERDTVSGSILVRFTPEMTGRTVYGLPNTTTPMQPSAYTIFGGTTPFRYAWSPAVGLSSTTASLPSFTLATNAAYSLTITDALGFTATTTVNVNVNGPFYYISGDAAQISSWNADSTGMASAPLSMAVPAEFIVRSTKVAQLQTPLTIISGGTLTIQTGATFSLADGVTLDNRGTVQIGGSLTLQDRAAVITTPIRWLGSKAVLTYSGSKPVASTFVEFPAAMTTASVVIENSGGVSLNGNRTVTTAFTLRAGALCNTSSATLRLLGDATLTGRFADDAAGVLSFEGSGTVTAPLSIAPPISTSTGTLGRLRTLSLARAGLRMGLGAPLLLTGQLILTSGTLTASANNFLRLAASGSNAVVGGSSVSFVEGAMQRVIPPKQSLGNTQEYRFPIGQREYLPFALVAPVTDSVGAIVQAEAFNARPTGRAGRGIATLAGTGYWQTRLLSGALVQTQVSISPKAALTLLNDVARADTPEGMFSGVGTASIETTAIVSLPLTDSRLLTGTLALGANIAPLITSFTPTDGTTGTVVSVRGEGFTTSATVSFGGVTAASVNVLSSTELNAVVANGTTGSIAITTPFGTAVSEQPFRFLLLPNVSSFMPKTAGVGGVVTIRGENFTTDAEVFFGGVKAQNAVTESETLISAAVGSGTSGPVTVRTRRGSAEAPEEFIFQGPPTITGFQERVVSTNAALSIIGTNLLGFNQIRIDGIRAEVIGTSAKLLRVRVPAGIASSPAEVRVSTSFGATSASVPIGESARITSFSPSAGVAGTVVTVQGVGFLGVTSAVIAGVNTMIMTATVTDTLLSIVAGNVRTRGTVVLQGSTGPAESVATFGPPPPVLTAFEPIAATSGTKVVLTGQNFQSVTSVTIGGVTTSNYMIDSPTQITVITPQRERGSGIVAVQNAGGTASSTLNNLSLFTFVPTQKSARSPHIDSFTPSGGGTGTAVVVQGVGLDSALVAYFGGTLAQRVVAVSSTVAILSVGAGSSGAVQVLTPNGTSVSQERFAYFTHRQVDSLALREAARLWSERTLGRSNTALNWLSTEPMERWQGITLDGAGRVMSITVTGASLVSALPDTLGQLSALRTLQMNGCNLQGELPRFLERLTALERLDLSRNELAGAIPPEIFRLPNLRVLNLSQNRFTGRLQTGDSATVLRKNLVKSGAATQAETLPLEQLDLSGNLLEGAVPAELSAYTALRILSLADNRFSGALPGGIATLAALEELNVAGNRLAGLPDFSALRRLRRLALERNRFDFAALEPNTSRSGVSYIPQDSIGEAGQVRRAPLESALVLNPNIRGSRISYQWFKNGDEIRALSVDSLFNIGFMRPGDAGEYVCRAVSPTRVPNLTLTTHTLTVIAAAPVPPSDVVRLQAPLVNSTNVATSATLRWQAIPPTADGNVRTLWYEAHVALDSGFRETVARVTTNLAQVLVEDLAELKAHWWRVRAVNSGGVGSWSELRSFVTASGSTRLAIALTDFRRTALGDTSAQVAVLTNQTRTALTINTMTINTTTINSMQSTDSSSFVLPAPLRNRTLKAGESDTVVVNFIPQGTGGLKTALLQVSFTIAGQITSTSATLQGKAGVFAVQTTTPETIIVGKRIVGTMTVYNRARQSILLEPMPNDAGAVFQWTGSGASARVKIDVRDSAIFTYSCLAVRESAVSGALRAKAYDSVETLLDDAAIDLRTTARPLTITDVVVRFGIRPSADSLAPGSQMSFTIVLDSGDTQQFVNAVQNDWQAVVGFDRNVLVPLDESVRELRGSDSTAREAQFRVSGSFPDLRGGVVARVQCRVVAGDTMTTRLRLASMGITPRTTDIAVLQSPARDTVFTAAISRAGGVRLITPVRRSGLLTALRPNPARETVEVAYSLVGAGEVEIVLADAAGKALQRIGQGQQSAGDHTANLKLSGLPSGAYTVMVRIAGETFMQKLLVER